MATNERPGSTVAIAIWLIIAGLGYALIAIMMFLVRSLLLGEGRDIFLQQPEFQQLPPEALALMGPVFFIIGLITLILALACWVLSYGLFAMKPWARLATIIFHGVLLGLSLFQLLGALLQGTITPATFPSFLVVIAGGAIAGAIIYAMQQPNVRQAFRRSPPSDS